MSTLTYTTRDSVTMLGRNLKHAVRYPSVIVIVAVMPIVFLLLFVYVFGDTLGDGLGVAGGGRAAYADYLTPGMLLMTIASAAVIPAISVAQDMTEGIIDRFRTMSIARGSVLTGHVLSSMIQTWIGVAAVLGVSFLVGFRPTAGITGWVGAISVLAGMSLAITWLSVAMGLVAKGVESASNMPMPLLLLPLLSSGFVPTDSLPAGLRWFAEYQPFTPAIETVRGMLTGTPIGNYGVAAVAWIAGLTLLGYVWARRAYNRRSQT